MYEVDTAARELITIHNLADSSGAPVVSVPSASGLSGRLSSDANKFFYRLSGSRNLMFIDPGASEIATIGGAQTFPWFSVQSITKIPESIQS